MKILHIEDRFHPGLGHQINNFAKLHDPRIEFHILSSNSFYPWKGSNPKEIITISDKDFEKKYNVIIHRTNILFEIHSRVWMKKLKKIILDINPDVIYAHGIETFSTIRVILSKLSKKYTTFTDTHTLLGQSKNKFVGSLFYFLFKRTVVPVMNKRNIGVFFTADENGMILKDIYRIRENNIHSCLIGTDTSKFYFDDIQRKSLREQYNIKNTDIAIIYTGKHNVIKQPHLVLEAVKNLERKNTIKLFLFFIGSKDEKYFKKHFGERSNYKFELIYITEIENDELYKYYSMADIAIFPKENTLSTLDVQACKLPVILEDNQTNRDRIRNSGLLYKKNNLSDLSDKIYELITNNELRKKLGENGLVLIEEVYDYKKIISDMENILTKNEP
ncbi:MAG: glycosyltransferase family 4 protein [Ignavibacteria bacterium]|nr:glycosyltransferase family 4 protein [Ignavibacteria bacterium]